MVRARVVVKKKRRKKRKKRRSTESLLQHPDFAHGRPPHYYPGRNVLDLAAPKNAESHERMAVGSSRNFDIELVRTASPEAHLEPEDPEVARTH